MKKYILSIMSIATFSILPASADQTDSQESLSLEKRKKILAAISSRELMNIEKKKPFEENDAENDFFSRFISILNLSKQRFELDAYTLPVPTLDSYIKCHNNTDGICTGHDETFRYINRDICTYLNALQQNKNTSITSIFEFEISKLKTGVTEILKCARDCVLERNQLIFETQGLITKVKKEYKKLLDTVHDNQASYNDHSFLQEIAHIKTQYDQTQEKLEKIKESFIEKSESLFRGKEQRVKILLENAKHSFPYIISPEYYLTQIIERRNQKSWNVCLNQFNDKAISKEAAFLSKGFKSIGISFEVILKHSFSIFNEHIAENDFSETKESLIEFFKTSQAKASYFEKFNFKVSDVGHYLASIDTNDSLKHMIETEIRKINTAMEELRNYERDWERKCEELIHETKKAEEEHKAEQLYLNELEASFFNKSEALFEEKHTRTHDVLDYTLNLCPYLKVPTNCTVLTKEFFN